MSLVAATDTANGIYSGVNDLLEITRLSVDPDLPVIIKPNLCCIKGPETGATTDPVIVEALIDSITCRFGTREFFIVESHATGLNADLAFRLLGYESLASRVGARITNLTSIPYRIKQFPHNYFLHKLKIPEIFDRPHFLISAAKLKTHSLCSFTGTLKNVYGCNPETRKVKYHSRLHEAIADVAAVFTPDFSIVDAIVAMTGSGPVGGRPTRMNRIIAGNDPVAVDAFIAKSMGLNPTKVRYLKLAEKLGVGNLQYEFVSSEVSCESLRLRTTLSDKLASLGSSVIQEIRRNQGSRY